MGKWREVGWGQGMAFFTYEREKGGLGGSSNQEAKREQANISRIVHEHRGEEEGGSEAE